jgi:hypothetical protein
MYPNPPFAPPQPPIQYRTFDDLAQLARAGKLSPDELLFDVEQKVWRRAIEWPELQPHFPSSVNWLAVGLGVLGLAALGFACASSNDDSQDTGWDRKRRVVFQRDSYTCVFCGHRGNTRTLHVDHVHPVSRGGSDELDNLVTACWSCNLEKGARTGWEYRVSKFFGN